MSSDDSTEQQRRTFAETEYGADLTDKDRVHQALTMYEAVFVHAKKVPSTQLLDALNIERTVLKHAFARIRPALPQPSMTPLPDVTVEDRVWKILDKAGKTADKGQSEEMTDKEARSEFVDMLTDLALARRGLHIEILRLSLKKLDIEK